MNGFKKVRGRLVPIYAPGHPSVRAEQVVLPESHPCRGCSIVRTGGTKAYCFLPQCRREEFKAVAHIK